LDWVNIGVFAGCAVLAELLTYVAFRRRNATKGSHAAVAIVLTLGLLGIARVSILPEIRARQFDAETARLPVVAALRTVDPAAHAEVLALARDAGRAHGTARSAMWARFRSTIAQTAMKHAGRASDEAVVNLVIIMVDHMKMLEAKNPEICRQYLFPPKDRLVDFAPYFSRADQDKEIEVLAGLIQSAADTPQKVPTEQEISAALDTAVDAITKLYGADVAVVEDGANPRNDAKKVCSITRALYEQILALPPASRGPVLRYLFSSAT
jgi:hypothetical protein